MMSTKKFGLIESLVLKVVEIDGDNIYIEIDFTELDITVLLQLVMMGSKI